MQPRVERHLAKLESLIADLKRHIQLRLIDGIDVGDVASIEKLVDGAHGGDVTLARLAEHVEEATGGQPIDQEWLRRTTGLVARLEKLVWRYRQGTTGKGRSSMGMINATGCTSVWGSTYPYNPYPFPWANHLFQDTASMAMGVFEGHMAKMAEGFRAVRQAELELAGGYHPAQHDEFFEYFDWKRFSDEEWELCPPVVAVGGDGAMYDIGFQNVSRAMMSGKPIKILVVDTQVYSNTGGQACTSGFVGQVSDMAQYGKAIQGKQEIRKEIGLIGMAHRTTYVLQGTIAHSNHLIEGFIGGLKARRPALFNIYTSCQPEHGIGDDMGSHQAKLAVESRAYPLFRYDPDRGRTPHECFDLEGNPSMDQAWPTYKLAYLEGGREARDGAPPDLRGLRHDRGALPEALPCGAPRHLERLHGAAGGVPGDGRGRPRGALYPYLWSVDRKQNHLSRLLVAKPIVESCRGPAQDFWKTLRAMALAPDRSEEISARDEPSPPRCGQEVVGQLASKGLMQLVGGGAGAGSPRQSLAGPRVRRASGTSRRPRQVAPGDYMAPWIDTEQCTTCDECTKLNDQDLRVQRRQEGRHQERRGRDPTATWSRRRRSCTAQRDPSRPAARPLARRTSTSWIAARPRSTTSEPVRGATRGMRLLGRQDLRGTASTRRSRRTTPAGLAIRQFPFAPLLASCRSLQHLGQALHPHRGPRDRRWSRGQRIAQGRRLR